MKVTLHANPAAAKFTIKRFNTNIEIFDSPNGNAILAGANGPLFKDITFVPGQTTKDVYVQWVSYDARRTADFAYYAWTANNLPVGPVRTVRFFKFTTLVVLIAGHTESHSSPAEYPELVTPGDNTQAYVRPQQDSGAHMMAETLYDAGYDVQPFSEDPGNTATLWRILNENHCGDGESWVRSAIASALSLREVQNIVLIGYSHGAGLVADEAEWMADKHNNFHYSLSLTAYTDAIHNAHGQLEAPAPETRYPSRSKAHMNWYQSEGPKVPAAIDPAKTDIEPHGAPTIAPPNTVSPNLNEDAAGDVVSHSSIDRDKDKAGTSLGIHGAITGAVQQSVSR